jgi:hypothetical protein
MVMSNIKFIRGLWGDFDELTPSPIYNEMVYVWGEKNHQKLIDRGFDCKLVSNENKVYLNEDEKFKHKLDCLKYGMDDFNRVIFLDWDIKSIKPIDEKFYSHFDDSDFMLPTYSYPKEFLNLCDFFDGNQGEWVNTQINEMIKCGWSLGDNIILPNAGFMYCSNKNIPEKLIEISQEMKLKTLVEEFATFYYVNCSLEEYIRTHEPSVIFGREIDNVFYLGPINRKTEGDLHRKILHLIEKDLYFIHE